jgi:formate--tetrahydrofolate ligase
MTDIEIAQKAHLKPISEIAHKLGLANDEYDCYGKYKAKIDNEAFGNRLGHLILVTAINPTPFGEGKTTMSIGLADGLQQIGKDTEPPHPRADEGGVQAAVLQRAL